MAWAPTLFLENFSPQGFADGEVYGNRLDPSGAWNAYAVRLDDPTQVRAITAGNELFGPGVTHRGVSDVSPDGRYMLLTIERESRFLWWRWARSPLGVPGKGANNEVWLATADATKAWRLSDINADRALGTFWPRFDATGNRVVWSQIVRAASWPEYLGGEQLVTGTLMWREGAGWELGVRQTVGNGRQYYEPYGFTTDGTAIVACSNELTPGQPLKAQTMLYPLDGSAPVRLTRALGDDYQEFAFLRPDCSGWVITSGYYGWIGSADRWLVDAADPELEPVRVTRFADHATGNPQWNVINGGMAFVSNDLAISGLAHGAGEDAYLIDIPGSES